MTQTLTTVLELFCYSLSAAYLTATAISRFAPRDWRITQWCAKHASDIRDLRTEVKGL